MLALSLVEMGAWAAPEPVRAERGMVASSSEAASRVGVEIMKRGGNAVDSAVAVALALAVTHPAAGNIGGGGFMLIRMADGRSIAIDYRETAPAAATKNMYLDSAGNPVARDSLVGYRAAGVPGTVAGLALALEKYGTMKWRDVVEPARMLADDGILVTPVLARSLQARILSEFPTSHRIFQRRGKFFEPGQVFKQRELAETLKRLRDKGPREFYEGHTADQIAGDMMVSGGLITKEDLKSYKPVLREALWGQYQGGYEILTMPPPSSGGVALLEMLHILEAMNTSALSQIDSTHVMVEAMRRAFADRAEFLGDPDFVSVPVAGLTSRTYAAELAKSIYTDKASPADAFGHGKSVGPEAEETTHFSVVDSAGNAVANTYTLNGGYGSGVTIRGAGFLMNNEMDDFAAKPGSPNGYGLIQGEANAIAPRKRPLSSMTPTIVLKDGKLLLVVGSPGGPTIINTVLEVILNVIDRGMNVRQAVDAPRFHHQWMPDRIDYEKGFDLKTKSALEAKGHRFADKPRSLGEVHAIMVDSITGARLGASDPRWADGRAVGY